MSEMHTEKCRQSWSDGELACDCGLWPTKGPMCVEELGWLRSLHTPPPPPEKCLHCGSTNMVVGEMGPEGLVWHCGDITEPAGSSERTHHWARSLVKQHRTGSPCTVRALDELGRARGSALIDGVLVEYEHTVEDEVHVRIETKLDWLDRIRLLLTGRFWMHTCTPVRYPAGPSALSTGDSTTEFIPKRVWPRRRGMQLQAGDGERDTLRRARRPVQLSDDGADSGPE